jgi:hypothetical protein
VALDEVVAALLAVEDAVSPVVAEVACTLAVAVFPDVLVRVAVDIHAAQRRQAPVVVVVLADVARTSVRLAVAQVLGRCAPADSSVRHAVAGLGHFALAAYCAAVRHAAEQSAP